MFLSSVDKNNEHGGKGIKKKTQFKKLLQPISRKVFVECSTFAVKSSCTEANLILFHVCLKSTTLFFFYSFILAGKHHFFLYYLEWNS